MKIAKRKKRPNSDNEEMRAASEIKDQLEEHGFAVIEDVVDDHTIRSVSESVGASFLKGQAGTRQPHEKIPAVRTFLMSHSLRSWIHQFFPGAFVVRTIIFDKNVEANWGVAWHQDLSICVRKKNETSGFGQWSVKDGFPHVQPPSSVLEGMLTMRVHLDDCGEDNGPLLVIPGSHRDGRLSPAETASWESKGPIVSCTAKKGGVVLMKPLLLHSSAPAKKPQHRRVLHVEYAVQSLPPPLEWVRPRANMHPGKIVEEVEIGTATKPGV